MFFFPFKLVKPHSTVSSIAVFHTAFPGDAIKGKAAGLKRKIAFHKPALKAVKLEEQRESRNDHEIKSKDTTKPYGKGNVVLYAHLAHTVCVEDHLKHSIEIFGEERQG